MVEGYADGAGLPDLGGQNALWDHIEFCDAFLEWPSERAGEGEVCCRVCGDAVSGGEGPLHGHLGGVHGTSLDAYREKYPGAPVEAENPMPDALR